jgi:hypothetical protein
MAIVSPPAAPGQQTQAPLRLVLVGLSGSGKTSLLGALAQSAVASGGRLDDHAGALAEVRRRTYGDGAARAALPHTAEEVVTYPVIFRPADEPPVPAVLVDCSGAAAGDVLAGKRPVGPRAGRGSLAAEVAHADALILTVDAAAPPARLEADFDAFGAFLRDFELRRGERVEVAGLPVFLVLTRCDLLARPNDTPADWLERIEERKRDVDTRFRALLEREAAGARAAFGDLDLQLWATAAHRPALGGAPARPLEPFGVADLFRQGVEASAAYRERRRRAGRRLAWTVGLSLGLAVGLLGLAAVLLTSPAARAPTPLERRVESLRFADRPAAAERLKAPADVLEKRAERLRAVRDDPGFVSLPAESRSFVEDRLAELETYKELSGRLLPLRPADAGSEAEVRKVREELLRRQPPDDWQGTEAAEMWAARLSEADALLAAAEEARNWYVRAAAEARDLLFFEAYRGRRIDWRAWSAEANALLDPPPGSGRQPPPRRTDPLRDARGEPLGVSRGVVLDFPEVADRQGAAWDEKRKQLEAALDVVAALGLAGLNDPKREPLAFDRPLGPEQAAERLKLLRAAYPRFDESAELPGLPREAREDIADVAATRYNLMLEPVRQQVLEKLKQSGTGAGETAARWQRVAEWLGADEGLRRWDELAALLDRLRGTPQPAGPAEQLRAFLKKASFPLEARRLRVEVPADLGARPALGQGNELRVWIKTRPDAGSTTWVFRWDGKESRPDPRGRTVAYDFERVEGGPQTYVPDDAFEARLPLADGRQLTWSSPRSQFYRFEALQRPPWLHRRGSKPDSGERLKGQAVQVQVLDPADRSWPRVPDLMPEVRWE